MGKVLPSNWGIRFIDAFAILVVVAIIARFVAPTSGLSIALQQLFHLLALGVQWLANGLVLLLNWI